jgi:hypothetical protein
MSDHGRASAPVEDEAQRGRAAARLLLDAVEHPGPIECSSQEFAEAALDEIELLQTSFPGVVKRMIDGILRAIKAKNPDPAHGLIEVFQNADDQGATEVRLALRRRKSGNQLLLVHNGERVRLDHIVGIVFPGITSKLEDADVLGRYGIGLKILYRLGPRLVAHCTPFHFEIEKAGLHRTAPEAAIPGFYDPDQAETLLVLDLNKGYNKRFFVDWLTEHDAASLLFLRQLRSIKLVDLNSGRSLVEHTLKHTGRRELKLELHGKRVPAERVVLRDAGGSRSWTRYRVTIPTAKGIERDGDKETGKTTTIALAVPARPARGNLYVGFRLDEPSSLPFSLDAQFDPDDSRSRLLHGDWNAWLLGELAELAAAVMLDRFKERPASGWACVPRSSEQLGEDGSWLRAQSESITELPRAACLERLRIRKNLPLEELSYESSALDKLLSEEELEVLAPDYSPLRAEWRDGHGRWREVMDDLEAGLTVDEGSLLSALKDEIFATRDPEWFVRVARAGLKAESYYLNTAAWIIAADGSRYSPNRVLSERVLLLKREADGLAAKLGLARQIDAAFLARNDDAREVVAWMVQKELLVAKSPSKRATLAALAARTEGEPIPLGGDDVLLLELRDALDELPPNEAEELGGQIGEKISVDGWEWRKGKRVKLAVRPSEAYLPRSLVSSDDRFPLAAGQTPGLKWIDAGYGTRLRGEDDGSAARGGNSTRKSATPLRGRHSRARAFFSALGAEVSPRVHRRQLTVSRRSTRAAPISRPRCVEQERALAKLNYANLHVVDDWDSADLEAVIADIANTRVKSDRRRRADALLATIGRRTNWSRLYEERVRAPLVTYSGNGSFYRTGDTLRTTWAARAASVQWLTSISGLAKAPRDLVLRTDAFIALHGEQPDLFVWGLEERDGDSPVLEAFAIEGRPQAITIVERLEKLREKELAGEEIEVGQVARCYAALARYCPGGPDADKANLNARELQVRFRRGQGLVRSQVGWRPPRQVFRGKDIFAGRRPRIDTAGAEHLWKTVGVDVPGIDDCVAVLREFAREKASTSSKGTLIAIYQHLERFVRETKVPARSLSTLPLQTQQGWRTKRPIYAVNDLALEQALAEKGVPVWRPPCRPELLTALLEALGVETIDDEAVAPLAPDAAALELGSGIEEDFRAAVDHFNDRLIEREFELHSLLGDWSELRTARVAISDELQQRVSLPGRKTATVPSEAYFVREPLTLCVRSEEALGSADAGGHAIAALFEGAPSRDYLALAWESAWGLALSGERAIGIELGPAEEESDPLGEWQGSRPRGAGKRGSMQRTSVKTKSGQSSKPTTAPTKQRQRLATFESIIARLPDGTYSNGSNGRASSNPGKRPGKLRQPSQNGGISHDNEPSGGKEYTNDDVQDLGLRVLDDRLRTWYGLELSDQHHLKSVGSDAVDEFAGFWVELKAHAGELPDSETLTRDEARRADIEKKRYLLVVIGGLAEGMEPEIRIFADPLRTLHRSYDRSVRLTGVLSKTGTNIRAPKASRVSP